MRDNSIAYIYLYRANKSNLNKHTLIYMEIMCECTQISHKKMWWVSEYSYEKCENYDMCYFDTNINRGICMKVMLIFIDIEMCIVDKYIYLYDTYCYLHHLCV